MTGDQATYRRSAQAIWRASLHCVVVVTSEGSPFVVSGAGARVWELLDRPRTVAELTSTLAEEFGVAEATVGHDLGPVLLELEHRCAVETTPVHQ